MDLAVRTTVVIVNKIPDVTTSMARVYRVVLPDTSDLSAIKVNSFISNSFLLIKLPFVLYI